MTTLERKCLEMELRVHLELLTITPEVIDTLVAHLMPFVERKILERRNNSTAQ